MAEMVSLTAAHTQSLRSACDGKPSWTLYPSHIIGMAALCAEKLSSG